MVGNCGTIDDAERRTWIAQRRLAHHGASSAVGRRHDRFAVCNCTNTVAADGIDALLTDGVDALEPRCRDVIGAEHDFVADGNNRAHLQILRRHCDAVDENAAYATIGAGDKCATRLQCGDTLYEFNPSSIEVGGDGGAGTGCGVDTHDRHGALVA